MTEVFKGDRGVDGGISTGAILTNARSNSDTIRVASGRAEGEDRSRSGMNSVQVTEKIAAKIELSRWKERVLAGIEVYARIRPASMSGITDECACHALRLGRANFSAMPFPPILPA